MPVGLLIFLAGEINLEDEETEFRNIGLSE
jgi:hypothetical protein